MKYRNQTPLTGQRHPYDPDYYAEWGDGVPYSGIPVRAFAIVHSE